MQYTFIFLVYDAIGTKMNEVKKTMKEILTGITFYALLVCIVGAFFVDNKINFVLGVLYGAVSSGIMMFHIYYTLNVSLEMEPEAAEKREKGMIVLRMVIMGVALAVGFLLSDIFNTIGILFGIFGLKIAAYLQPVLHDYIFKNKEKRRVKV